MIEQNQPTKHTQTQANKHNPTKQKHLGSFGALSVGGRCIPHAQVHEAGAWLLLASFSGPCSSACINRKENVFALLVCFDSRRSEFQVCL